MDPNKYAAFGPFCLNENGLMKKLIDFLGGFITIGRNHREVHEGEFFETGHTFLGVSNGSSVRIRFKAGSAKQFHYGFEVIAEGKCFAKLYRGTTYTADGTPIDITNNSCASSNLPTLTAFHTPTVDTIGDELTPENGILVPGGSGGVAIGSSVKSDEERISAVDTDYLLVVTNDAGVARDFSLLVGGYESSTILT